MRCIYLQDILDTTRSHAVTFFLRNLTGGGDVDWVERVNNPLYLGTFSGGSVKIGVCDPNPSCGHFGMLGSKPSRILQ